MFISWGYHLPASSSTYDLEKLTREVQSQVADRLDDCENSIFWISPQNDYFFLLLWSHERQVWSEHGYEAWAEKKREKQQLCGPSILVYLLIFAK